MDKLNLLLLSIEYGVNESVSNSGMIVRREFLNNGVLCLDYQELYNRYGFDEMHNYIKKYIKKNEINCVVYICAGWEFHFDVHFFEEIRKESFVVMLTGDSEYYHEVRERYYAQAMDLVITTDYIGSFRLHQMGIDSMVYWGECDGAKYHKTEDLPKDIDVSFVGQSVLKGRLEYINYLLENNIKVEAFGNGFKNGTISPEEKVGVYNRSKINLNFAGIGEDILTRKHKILYRGKQIKGRILEAAMCGGFVLSEYAPGIENIFEIGKEIDVFRNKKELLEKVNYYLENEEERENIARRGYQRAIRDYDVKLAVPKLISTIDEKRKKKIYEPSEIYLDEEFIRNFTTYRALWIIRFIKQRKWGFAFEEFKLILKYKKLDWWQIRIFFIEEILNNFPRIKSALKLIFKRSKK